LSSPADPVLRSGRPTRRRPGGPGSTKATTPIAPCRAARPDRPWQNRLLPICCPRRAIRGRSTAERAS